MPDERLLIATRRPGHGEPEAEPVLVSFNPHGTVELTFDDGVAWEFDAMELRAAVAPVSQVGTVSEAA